MSSLDFILAVEQGELSREQFDLHAQAFVDSGVWRHLQGSWQRAVLEWARAGLVTLDQPSRGTATSQ